MSKQAFYNGILYQIEYQPELSNNDYTQHKVYHIKTQVSNFLSEYLEEAKLTHGEIACEYESYLWDLMD